MAFFPLQWVAGGKVVSKYSEIIDLEIAEPDLEVIVKKIYRKGK